MNHRTHCNRSRGWVTEVEPSTMTARGPGVWARPARTALTERMEPQDPISAATCSPHTRTDCHDHGSIGQGGSDIDAGGVQFGRAAHDEVAAWGYVGAHEQVEYGTGRGGV